MKRNQEIQFLFTWRRMGTTVWSRYCLVGSPATSDLTHLFFKGSTQPSQTFPSQCLYGFICKFRKTTKTVNFKSRVLIWWNWKLVIESFVLITFLWTKSWVDENYKRKLNFKNNYILTLNLKFSFLFLLGLKKKKLKRKKHSLQWKR